MSRQKINGVFGKTRRLVAQSGFRSTKKEFSQTSFQREGAWAFLEQYFEYILLIKVLLLALCIALILFFEGGATIWALDTVPQTHIYNGYLLDSNSNPLQSAHTFRFSFWTTADYVESDVADGVINPASPTYLSWMEEHTVTPDSNGYFSLEIGNDHPFPRPDHASSLTLYLQVEVRSSSNPVSAFELLDTDPTNETVDRSPIAAVPSATNADYLDWAEIGTGEGDIPVLLEGGVFSMYHIPPGVPGDVFTIDADGNAVERIVLQFGEDTGETLSYDIGAQKFVFSDDVYIQGNLVIENTITATDIEGVVRDDSLVFLPDYPGAGYMGDGSNNIGQLLIENDGSVQNNYYTWRTSRSDLNDYDLVLSIPIPERFQRWNDDTLALRFRTQSSLPKDASVDVYIFDSSGTPVTLTAPTEQLVSGGTWQTIILSLPETATWTPGGEFQVRLRFHSTNQSQANVEKLQLSFQRML